MPSRRGFLVSMPALSAVATLSMPPASMLAKAPAILSFESQRLPLEEGWLFRLDPDAARDVAVVTGFESGWQEVSVPHTSQTLGGSPDYLER